MVKARRAQRASEGTIVATNLATKNARGAKGPCGGPVGDASTREGMTGSPGSNHPDGRRPVDKVRQLQRRLWVAAKRSPERRFHALMDRLGSRVVTLTRLQASLDVAARVLALSMETFDTPLEPRDSHHALGVCYSALRCLPRRDLHPLEKGSVEQ
jgi:hypothetical protein